MATSSSPVGTADDPPRRRLLLLVAKEAQRSRLGRGLREAGYSVYGAADIADARALLASQPVDLIVAETPAETAAEPPPIARLAPLFAAGPALFLLGQALPPAALRAAARAALSAGAYDYLPLPDSGEFAASDIALALEKAAAREARRGDPAAGRFLPATVTTSPGGEAASPAGPPAPQLIVESPGMRALLGQVGKLAPHRTPVLLTGESGTGKEMIARTLHALSPRRAERLVAVNCGALPENLLESLLFGHRRGAFTDAVRDQRGLFAEADHGTLFLDEVGELPAKLQVKLLRVLQDQRVTPLGAESDQAIAVDVRLIAATLRDLEADVESGRFRADLYYRLSVVPLKVPPLRQRGEDILPLARLFLGRAASRLQRPLHAFTPGAEQALLHYRWPGNVRELENAVERAAVLCDHTLLDRADLPLAITAPSAPPSSAAPPPTGSDPADLSVKRATRRLEESLIQAALTQTRGNRSAAARLLGLSHRALLYKLRDYGLAAKSTPAGDGEHRDD